MDDSDRRANRQERRKQRTRAALIKAAQRFIAAGKVNVPVQDISHAADVGVGSFYNHFDSKEELFQAAVNEVLDAHGALLDAIADASEDPAETFARSFRLTGRMFRRRPEESGVVLSHGLELITSDRGLAPRSKRDIAAAAAAGRFDVEDPELAMAVAAGALLGLGQLLCDQPERDAAQATDEVAENLLRLFGMPAEEAHRLCLRPLPFLDDGVSAVV
ncbi:MULTISPECIES: TetR/AcrR family transcriptional regulator [Mycobacterium]|uniref:HTH-type transcriptional regulator TtgR n=1 Tax=Mycobacterium persicum TaxID=1487726 RepID=A0AB38UV21_9MYCO|nr:MULTISPECIES: TetR/AcrR family transcriptional regulator [Mycobacterium]KZS86042.1 TetR family transcriptional regulator [Mycobacterium persicum]ORB51443.1 TetR family transcriptional regulator [Mycobacterium persicum]ORB88407.1 TetR family transcriptional regulator [Mycobacterium persicum]ORB93718.1 TetR family transcriptional regulator [Mycobacterium persicum]ORC00454.1 TetR family transcriptional regulator [Mycobacterium persicum]